MSDAPDPSAVNARIVYWGAEGAGKRTNLRVIHAKLRADHRGDLRFLPTRLDPTVMYGVLPIELGEVGGVRTRIQIVSVPGDADQIATRKQLLDRADGIVLVMDSRRERLAENVASFEDLRSALAAYGRRATFGRYRGNGLLRRRIMFALTAGAPGSCRGLDAWSSSGPRICC